MRENLIRVPGLLVVALCALLVSVLAYSVFTLVEYKGESELPVFSCIVLILTSVFAIVYFIYTRLRGKGNEVKHEDSIIERTYRLRLLLNVASLAVVIIFILSYIVVSLLECEKMKPEEVTNFYTAFIALCTTFVVGFQIYNSIEMNKKFDEIDAEKRSMQEQIKDLKKLNQECRYFNAYSIGTIRYNEASMNDKPLEDRKRYCWNALRAYFNALSIAAEDGVKFNEAMVSFGKTKMARCIEELDRIHKEYPYSKADGTADSVMPEFDDRIMFIRQIGKYIARTMKLLEASDKVNEPIKARYESLASAWLSFVDRYYKDLI